MRRARSRPPSIGLLALALALALALVAPRARALDNGAGLKPPMGMSTWNYFGASINETLLLSLADAMVSSGLRDAGWTYLNVDDGWAVGRAADGTLVADPVAFPRGLAFVADYVHARGLRFGLYTSYTSLTCQGRPGSLGHEALDAATFAAWGVDYLKVDDCGGATNGTAWESYARMRDGLNATGRSVYLSVCQLLPYAGFVGDGNFTELLCFGGAAAGAPAYTVLPWLAAGLAPQELANAYLIEWCNNEATFGETDKEVGIAGSLLSNLDAQQLLTFDNLTMPGAFSDMDMLEICNPGLSQAEARAELSLWVFLASPLILGNDIRSMSADCLELVLNTELLAVSQDDIVVRARKVLSWPGDFGRTSAAATAATAPAAVGDAAPPPVVSFAMQPCNASDANQLFFFNASGDGQIYLSSPDFASSPPLCITFGGQTEGNVYGGPCSGWAEPNMGAQLWNASTNGSMLCVAMNYPYLLSLRDCSFAPGSVQVCSLPRGDCGSCGADGAVWNFSAALAPAPPGGRIAAAAGGFSHCLAPVAPPPPKYDIRLQIWARPLANGDEAVLMFNRSPSPLLANLTWAMLGWPAGREARARDLWQHADVGLFAGGLSVEVAPHDVIALRLTPTS